MARLVRRVRGGSLTLWGAIEAILVAQYGGNRWTIGEVVEVDRPHHRDLWYRYLFRDGEPVVRAGYWVEGYQRVFDMRWHPTPPMLKDMSGGGVEPLAFMEERIFHEAQEWEFLDGEFYCSIWNLLRAEVEH